MQDVVRSGEQQHGWQCAQIGAQRADKRVCRAERAGIQAASLAGAADSEHRIAPLCRLDAGMRERGVDPWCDQGDAARQSLARGEQRLAQRQTQAATCRITDEGVSAAVTLQQPGVDVPHGAHGVEARALRRQWVQRHDDRAAHRIHQPLQKGPMLLRNRPAVGAAMQVQHNLAARLRTGLERVHVTSIHRLHGHLDRLAHRRSGARRARPSRCGNAGHQACCRRVDATPPHRAQKAFDRSRTPADCRAGSRCGGWSQRHVKHGRNRPVARSAPSAVQRPPGGIAPRPRRTAAR